MHNDANLDNFGNLGGSCTHSSLPITAYFGTLEYTPNLHLRAKFHPQRDGQTNKNTTFFAPPTACEV